MSAVSSGPAAFTDDEGWWLNFFLEPEFTVPRTIAGDTYLYQLVHHDEAGRWVLDHPGFEDVGEESRLCYSVPGTRFGIWAGR